MCAVYERDDLINFSLCEVRPKSEISILSGGFDIPKSFSLSMLFIFLRVPGVLLKRCLPITIFPPLNIAPSDLKNKNDRKKQWKKYMQTILFSKQ